MPFVFLNFEFYAERNQRMWCLKLNILKDGFGDEAEPCRLLREKKEMKKEKEMKPRERVPVRGLAFLLSLSISLRNRFVSWSLKTDHPRQCKREKGFDEDDVHK